jgi:arginine decarboxylase
MWFETTGVALTQGCGTGGSPLNAFDNALRDSGIADFNLIKVSSIVPPRVPVMRLKPQAQPISGEGLMVPTIYIEMTSDQVGTKLAVAVGAGIPKSYDGAGIVFVAGCEGSRQQAEESVSEMVAEGMEKKGTPAGDIHVASIHTVVCEPWTSVLAAAVFMDDVIEGTVRDNLIEASS